MDSILIDTATILKEELEKAVKRHDAKGEHMGAARKSELDDRYIYDICNIANAIGFLYRVKKENPT